MIFVSRLYIGPLRILLPLGIAGLFCFCSSAATYSQTSASGAWKVFLLGEPALQINLPEQVIPMETPIAMDQINHLQRFDTYRLYHAEGKVVAMFRFRKYSSPIKEALPDILEKDIADVMQSVHATEVVKSVGHFKLNKIKGLKAKGTFIANDATWVFQEIVLMNTTSVWQIWVGGENSGPAFPDMVKRIVSEMHF